jgi:thermitase
VVIMKSALFSLLLIFYSSLAGSALPFTPKPVYTAKTIKVAVIDTGFDFKSAWKNLGKDQDGRQLKTPKLCKEGHKDFTGTGLQDNSGHGTHVAGIIAKFAEDADYCLVILKFYDPLVKQNSLVISAQALKYAYNLGVDMINYSGGGDEFSLDEYLTVKKILDKGVIFVAAAGNEKTVNDFKILKVDVQYEYKAAGDKAVYNYKMYYPADYDSRVISVGNVFLDEKTKKLEIVPSSNRGDAINFTENGMNILSLRPNNSIGYMTGTSQASPTRAGKMLKMWGNK